MEAKGEIHDCDSIKRIEKIKQARLALSTCHEYEHSVSVWAYY